jgi:leucyl aminopeptidase
MRPRLHALSSLEATLAPDARWDALVVVSRHVPPQLPEPLLRAIARVAKVDRTAEDAVTLVVTDDAPGGRLVCAPTGPLERDHDDVRRVAEAAREGVARAVEAGARRPALLLRGVPAGEPYAKALPVAALGALAGLWEPLEAREALGEDAAEPTRDLGVIVPEEVDAEALLAFVAAVEDGRRLARDLAGTQPERMSPPRFADYCRQAFEGTDVEVEVVSDADVLRADYPLLNAVARASLAVPRHQPRVVRLSWQGEGPVQETLLLAGKGVTYDTGGADLKTGGHMAGMSRDKGGAAAVAGFLRAVAALAPRGLRVEAELGVVRNSIGADAFVTDEILVSHAGVRVRVGNTDAEGRLVLADCLSHLRKKALDAVSPRVFSVATLTGHSAVAVGPYTIAMDNGPARRAGIADSLVEAGEAWGEPVEQSRLRREDWDFVAPRTHADDVLSANNKPSSATPRGHQFPMAFLATASGLAAHGGDSDLPLAFTHMDIGGSGVERMDWQHGQPTGTPIVALAGRWLTSD